MGLIGTFLTLARFHKVSDSVAPMCNYRHFKDRLSAK